MKRFLPFLLLLASLAVLLALPACESDRPNANYSTKVAIDVKDFGTIKLELDPTAAPKTVANFACEPSVRHILHQKARLVKVESGLPRAGRRCAAPLGSSPFWSFV